MSGSKERIAYLSRIRTVAGMAIVILHTFTIFHVAEKDIMSESEEYVTRLVPYLMMWAVPCFIMVSGVLLLNPEKEISIGKILSHYVLRMLIVLLLFTVIYFYLDVWMNQGTVSAGDWKTILDKFFKDGSWAHLWYLYLLVGIYLLLPAFRPIAGHMTTQTAIYLGILFIIFLSLVPSWERYTGETLGFSLVVSSVFPLYLFLGDSFHRGILKGGKLMGLILTLAGVVVIILLSRIDFGEKQGVVDKLLGNYAFLPVIVLSVGAFLLLKGTGGGKWQKVWSFLDRYSFGIYLTHLIFLRFLIKVVKWNPLSFGSFWMLIPVAILTYGASLLLCMLLKLIPGVKKLI